MGSIKKEHFMLHIFFLMQIFQTLTAAKPKFPCFFIFGDSFVDNGNNKFLERSVRVDFLPYGIDFPAGPTGRHNNGRNIADILAKRLGFNNSIPPFANGTTKDILEGLNYGSGGGGILDETGNPVNVLSLSEQLSNHEITISKIEKLLNGEGGAKKHLSSCLYYVGIGTNDYILNFLPQFYISSTDYSPKEFAKHLINEYSTLLQRLYRNGARKVAVMELGNIGCMPAIMAAYGDPNSSSCVETTNHIVQIFNDNLKTLINGLNRKYPEAKFVHVRDITLTASTGNITIMSEPCCEVGIGVCIEGSVPCSNRDEYRFWDEVHPTEAAVVAAANTTYNDISQLFNH